MDKFAKFIRNLYKYRCIVCRQSSKVVHEIIPRSQTEEWDVLDNRVVLCPSCHENVHKSGALNHEDFLRKKQKEVLLAYYDTTNFGELYERLS